jgi:predicted flap endonuclease-1-like 5' DNA nuclease
VAQMSSSEESWPAGWVYAVVAGVIGAILARWIGDVAMPAAVMVGLFVFLIFGVLLGMFWGVPPSGGNADGAGRGHNDGHGHYDQGHADHGHQELASVVVPVSAAAPFVAVAPAPSEVAAHTPVAASAPVAEQASVAVSEVKPTALNGPRDGVADKLQAIEGIGPAMEKLCHELGIYHFDQIAAWGAGEVAWMDSNLKGFKGRVTRDRWVRQAALIGEFGVNEFLRRAKTNDY